MKLDEKTLALAVGAGALTGIRSMSALTVISASLAMRSADFRSGPAGLLASPMVSTGLRLAAVGEVVADKLPFVPSRTQPLPLLGRAAVAAVAGAAVAQIGRNSPVAAATVAALAGICSATVATGLRRFGAERIGFPSVAAGLLEDALVLRGATALARELGR